MHVHVCAYTIACVCMHTHYTHIYCEIQPHRVSCRRNWPGKSQLWHPWAASSAWVPADNLSSEAATGSSHFPGCQIPVTFDPKRDRNCSCFLRAHWALRTHHCSRRVARRDKVGLDDHAASVTVASLASPGVRAWHTEASREGCWAEPKFGMSSLSEGRRQLSCPASQHI